MDQKLSEREFLTNASDDDLLYIVSNGKSYKIKVKDLGLPIISSGSVVLSADEFDAGDIFGVKEVDGKKVFAPLSRDEVRERYFNDLFLLVQTADLLGGEIDLFNLDGVSTNGGGSRIKELHQFQNETKLMQDELDLTNIIGV